MRKPPRIGQRVRIADEQGTFVVRRLLADSGPGAGWWFAELAPADDTRTRKGRLTRTVEIGRLEQLH